MGTFALLVTTLNPSPPVTVTSVHWETIKVKVGNGNKAKTKSETALEIEFSGLVAGSGDLAAYQLSSVTTKKVKKRSCQLLRLRRTSCGCELCDARGR